MRQHRVLSFTALLGCALSLSACASIVSGGHQSVTLNSNPEGATVAVDGNTIGKTPMTTFLKKKPGQNVMFTLDGYMPITTQLQTGVNPWFFGNIIIGGLIGSSTDALSGAIYQYSPSQYLVTLQPAAFASAGAPLPASVETGSNATPVSVSDGAHAMETYTALTDSQRKKDYIVRNYDGLLNDLKSGPAAKPGENLSALLSLLHVKPSLEYDAIKRISALSTTYTDVIEFADHVIQEFGG